MYQMIIFSYLVIIINIKMKSIEIVIAGHLTLLFLRISIGINKMY